MTGKSHGPRQSDKGQGQVDEARIPGLTRGEAHELFCVWLAHIDYELAEDHPLKTGAEKLGLAQCVDHGGFTHDEPQCHEIAFVPASLLTQVQEELAQQKRINEFDLKVPIDEMRSKMEAVDRRASKYREALERIAEHRIETFEVGPGQSGSVDHTDSFQAIARKALSPNNEQEGE